MLLLNLLVAHIISLVMLILIFSISKKAALDSQKLSPFECGFSTLSESRNPLSLRFFLVTLIFLVFDVELILLFPFMFKFIYFSPVPYVFIFILFVALLSLGLFLEWNQFMLEWV